LVELVKARMYLQKKHYDPFVMKKDCARPQIKLVDKANYILGPAVSDILAIIGTSVLQMGN